MPQSEKSPAHWKVLFRNEDGTALVMAIVASLLLLVFAISFSSLANLEARIGINDYRSRQAQLVGEAGFEAVRNHLRPVNTDYTNFLGNTYTCDPSANPVCTCTTGAHGNPSVPNVPCTTTGLFPVAPGVFTIRVDNDPQDPGGATNTDQNGQVILTSLGRTAAGNGRAQSRVQVLLDDPFKHVCASPDVNPDCATYTGDNPCTPMGIYVQPCQPEDPHGPKVFPALPTPTMIDISPLDGRYGCISTPVTGWAARWALENGGSTTPKVIGNTNPAQSYFDIALSVDAEPLRLAGWIPDAPAGRNRHAYCALGSPGCTANPAASPNSLGCGLVIDPDWPSLGGGAQIKFINKAATEAGEGNAANTVVVYVTGTMSVSNSNHVQGTIVVHGNATPGDFDVNLSPDFCLNRVSNGSNCGVPNSTVFAGAPGYPFAFIIWHPGMATPQNTIAKIANTGIMVSGIVYSGGSVTFNPISIDGGVVAWTVAIQGNSQLIYNPAYGAASKSGFDIPPGSFSAQFMRSTWLHCRQTDLNNDFVNPNTTPECN